MVISKKKLRQNYLNSDYVLIGIKVFVLGSFVFLI